MADLVYTTTQFIRHGSAGILPASIVHAKVLGTSSTLCGIECSSWRKFLNIRFSDAAGSRCPQCMNVFVAGLRR